MKMENLNMPWDYGADIADSVFHESLHNNQLPLTNARTLKDLMPARDLTLLDLYEREIDLNEQNTLHGATKGFRLEIVHSLVEQHGANIDGRDPDGRTALHWAAELGHLALVQYLGGDMGASVDAQCNSGYTALHLAALEGRLDVVQYLIETLGADTEARDTNGETALHLAAGAGWLEVVKYISSVKAFQATKTSPSLNVPKIEIEECL